MHCPAVRGALGALAFLIGGAIGPQPVRPAPAAVVTHAAQAVAAQAVQTPTAPRLDASRMLDDVKTLSSPEFEGRLTGTPGSRRAQSLIVERFKQLKLEPIDGSFERRFSFTATRGQTKREFPEATNLVALVRGVSSPDELVLVTAHYDHLGVRDGQVYHGADDNASGVAAMLAVAGWFANHPPARSLVVVAFDAEEQGLQGAKHFVANPPIDVKRVKAVVNIDMLGRGDKNVLFVAGTSHNPALKPLVDEAASGRRIKVAFGHDRPGVQGEDDWTQSSDHGPFHSAGIPFLYFGVEDHPDYHKPTDTADKIPLRFFHEAAEIVLDTVGALVRK